MALTNLLNKLSGNEPEVPEKDEFDDYEEDLDPDEEILEPDPKPSRLVEGIKDGAKAVIRQRSTPKKLTKAQKTDIADKLEFMVKMPGSILAMRDPICGMALADNSVAIAESMVPLIARNPSLLKYFTEDGGGFAVYMGVALAMMPVATTVYGHHVSHSIGDHVHDEGTVYGLPNF